MENKKSKKRLNKIPDVSRNGEPIYKIDFIKIESSKAELAKKHTKRVRARIIL
jgi:hypothetical protein